MKITTYIKTFIFFLLILAFSACQKVVVLDLNTAEPMIVIEGNITSAPHPLLVFISTSGSYYTSEGIEPIEGATVTVKDENQHTDTLEMYAPGYYYSYNVNGEENMEYTIEVTSDGKFYTGSEVFPTKKTIDSLSFVRNEGIFGDGGLNEDGDTTYNVMCRFQDPAETLDFYRFTVSVNDSIVKAGFRNYLVTDDELFNGQLFDYELSPGATKGDTVTVEFQSIGYNTYQYYLTLNDALSGGMGSTPYNPISNLSNDALGYFGAYTSDKSTIIIE